MPATNDDRPLAMVNVVWRQYRALALTARGMKASQNKARIWTLLLAFGGGLLSTLAGVTGVGALGVLAAAAIALAGYVGKELLSPTREDEWVRCRVLAEALKRDVFKALVRASPYDGPSAGDELHKRVESLLTNSALKLDADVMKRADDKTLPVVETVDDYIKERVHEQIEKFYLPSAAEHQKQLLFYKRLTFALGAAAAVMSAFGAKFHTLALWVPVVTTATAAVAAFIQAQRFQGLVPLYLLTVSQLELAVASWEGQATARSGSSRERIRELTTAFVSRCEDILSKENEAWRAEWESKDKKGSVDAFVKQLDDAKT